MGLRLEPALPDGFYVVVEVVDFNDIVFDVALFTSHQIKEAVGCDIQRPFLMPNHRPHSIGSQDDLCSE